MADNESKIAFFRIEISKNPKVTRELIRSTVVDSPWSFSEAEQENIIRHLEHTFDITQTVGSSLLSSDYKPWLSERRQTQTIDFFYWPRLKRYYLEKGVLPPNVVATLDTDTDEILDYSGNPALDGSWKRRGMVMGHVQSGKTTNYSTLICKAADAGYKVIILLAGITNSLRQQTQERLDETFIGKKSVFQAAAQEPLSIINYAEQRRFPAYGTSRDRDFLKDAASTYGVSLAALNEPIIFVTKKNKTTLERLRDWLKEQNMTNKINQPILLVDDEADNASINTASNPNQVTAINKAIREILAMFSRSTYIGYTATPFANIFIDPESENEMIEDDLFPRDFIKALDPPNNYVGATRVFAETGDLASSMVVRLDSNLDNYEAILPLKHKRDLAVVSLPESLKGAIRAFVITRAIRILRGDGNKHCSMMINVSRFNDVQQSVYGLVYTYLDAIKNSIIISAGLGTHAFEDLHIKSLNDTFDAEYDGVEFSFENMLAVLGTAVNSISVRTINMRGGVLDYSKHKDTGLHVIAIGGLALSRGLTLEGLTVSYILRNASASDTLMQMARWFGYRQGYEDICKLYLPDRSANHYEFITEAIEELRGEIKRMELVHMTPNDFGLRVRHDPTAIRITAANKMRTATQMTIAQDYSGRHIEGYVLYNNDNVNKINLKLFQDLIGKCGSSLTKEKNNMIWSGVDSSIIFPFLKEFSFPEDHAHLGLITTNRSLFVDYVSDRLDADLKSWDIALPLSSSGGFESVLVIPGEKLSIRRRKAGEAHHGKYWVTGGKFRVANPGDEQIGLSGPEREAAEAEIKEGNAERGCCSFSRHRLRPLLIVHVFHAELKPDHKGEELRISDPVVSLSFCLPATTVTAVERIYQVNKVYRNQMLEMSSEVDDDEQMINGEDYA
jgi:hypothetical protein